jgi:hypothetical protein
MTRLLHLLFVLFLMGTLLTAGCTSLFDTEDAVANITADPPAPASYAVTLSQPNVRSDDIRMDTDVYNVGEVVEFSVMNRGMLPLECANTPPDFRVTFQTSSGRWATRMGPDAPVKGNVSFIKKGESTKIYRFVTQGWDVGRYRIISDCGAERDILVRSLATPAPTPAPTACPTLNATANTTPWLKVDSVSDQYAGRPFTVTGTTNLPVGQELTYTIFSLESGSENVSVAAREGTFSTVVEEGACGINRWSAMGEIQATGNFFIGISDKSRLVSGIRRFAVLPP